MCGVFGIRSDERDVSRLAYFGLFALQHRGQESAGIAVAENGRLTAVRELGLVSQVFDEQTLRGLRGEIAIGHTRYSTTGSTHWVNAQPLVHHGRARTVALGHNGNLTNAEEVREELAEALDGDPVVASESCAFDLVGADFVREIAPGELVVIDEDGVHARQAVASAGPGKFCIFEFFYLARPDSTIDGVEIHGARVRMGEQLAREAPVEADLVMAIPDSGTPAAIGYSRQSGIPYNEGLIKNRYVGRTFIQPEQGMREQGIRVKYNPLTDVAGKRVVAVDDSIVRGNTTRQIVSILFEAGATEVHVRISSPPIVSPCFYGIDFGDADQLIASERSIEEVRRQIGATSLAYLSLDGLQESTQRPEQAFCRACLTREYPTRIPEGRTLAKMRFEPSPA
jgi:amidophosphoribosyltransferase